MPDLDELPLATPIPYILKVITVTKPVKHDEYSADDDIFPAPPLEPGAVEFFLDRNMDISARGWSASTHDVAVCPLGGCGTDSSPAEQSMVQVQAMDKVWTPVDGEEKKKRKGSWRQEVVFRSHIQLACPPSFQFETVALSVSPLTSFVFTRN